MIKRLVSLTMIGLMFNLVCNTSVVAKSKSREIEFAAKVKAAVARLGSGNHARIEVKLHDKRKVKGYVAEAGDDGFSVVDEKTGLTTHVPYSEVRQVKGKNNLNGEKIAIAVALIAILTLIAILQINCNENC